MPTIEELSRLLAQPHETLAVEYKSWLDITVNHNRGVLAKACIAIANHGGGIVVLGMRQPNDAGALQSHPKPEGMKRYTQDDINGAVNRFADPHIHCELMFAKHPGTETEHAFVCVPGGSKVPIMSRRAVDGVIHQQKCYIRKAGPRSEEPFNSEEWRTVLDRCVRAGRNDMLDAIRAIVHGTAGQSTDAVTEEGLLHFAERANARWQELLEPLPATDPARMRHGYREFAFELRGIAPAVGLAELRRRIHEAGQTQHTGWPPFQSLN